MAGRARSIYAITREQHAHVHLVSLGFEPTEIALYPIPRGRPLVFLVLAVFGVPIDNEGLPFLRKFFEGNIGRDLEMTACAQQIALTLEAMPGLPGFNQTPSDGFGTIRQCQVVVDADDAPKPAAGGAST